MDPSNKAHVSAGSSSNKIRQIVRLQQLLKKWKKIAAASPSSPHLHNNLLISSTSINNSSSTKSINKFLKKTLSFSEKDKSPNAEGCSINSSDAAVVPKGCLAVAVGKEDDKEEVKRFVIPMDYLGHPSFQILLREAEEEFGFQQQGLLKIPCEVPVFEKILKNINSSNKRQQQPAPAHDHDAFFQLQQRHRSSDLSTINNVVVDDNNIIHNVGCCSPDNNHQHHQGIMPPQLCS